MDRVRGGTAQRERRTGAEGGEVGVGRGVEGEARRSVFCAVLVCFCYFFSIFFWVSEGGRGGVWEKEKGNRKGTDART